ncbi:Bud-site selection protein [Amylocystis lapponica]|nr:Bud-site selection protein [Amylocystis lapponica]
MSGITKKHGVKRKRGEAIADDPVAKVSGKLFHGLREVRKAARKAKTFETQKLVKKLKASRSKDPKSEEVVELEAQLDILKRTDHEPVANSALLTKLKKDHLLSTNPHAQGAIATHLTSNLLTPSLVGTSAAKVESRLLSSKVLGAEVHAVVDALREVIQPTSKKPPQDSEDALDESEAGPPLKTRRLGARVPDPDSSENSGEASGILGEEPDEAGWGSGSVRENGPDDEDGWESGSVDGSGLDQASSGASSSDQSSDSEDDEGEPVSHAHGRDDIPTAASSRAKATKSKAPATDPKGKSRATAAETMFLPSLSVGFVRGDSDGSDWSDADADIADGAPKKNRRGQRARRAIWEKKFGKNANHVKKEREFAAQDPRHRGGRMGREKDGGTSRTARPHMRKGSAPGARSQFTAPSRDSGWVKGGQPATERPGHTGAEKKGGDKPLHPSWEAKRRLKEKLNPSIVPAQGKKIVF